VPDEVKALPIIFMNDPVSIPISLPQVHCIFCSRAVKLYFWVILALWHRKTSPGPILSYFQSLFLHAAQRITSIFSHDDRQRFFCVVGTDRLIIMRQSLFYTSGPIMVKRTFSKMITINLQQQSTSNTSAVISLSQGSTLCIMPYNAGKRNSRFAALLSRHALQEKYHGK